MDFDIRLIETYNKHGSTKEEYKITIHTDNKEFVDKIRKICTTQWQDILWEKKHKDDLPVKKCKVINPGTLMGCVGSYDDKQIEEIKSKGLMVIELPEDEVEEDDYTTD